MPGSVQIFCRSGEWGGLSASGLQLQQQDYGTFLTTVFEEVRRQQLSTDADTYVDLNVEVPEGVAPGQLLVVEYLGVRYEVAVPEGHGPGMVFQTRVATE